MNNLNLNGVVVAIAFALETFVPEEGKSSLIHRRYILDLSDPENTSVFEHIIKIVQDNFEQDEGWIRSCVFEYFRNPACEYKKFLSENYKYFKITRDISGSFNLSHMRLKCTGRRVGRSIFINREESLRRIATEISQLVPSPLMHIARE